ncbi:uncharacterized protein LOC123905167 [Trifolium pratense]|uniref:uncharacterized protein LOC123905167 n=1 Tax=Trifolium pratense TaxID=57577 RepID=UPI001E691129|nr:uncharacterized protein LOC123905167 [Trifolium pratense]
MSKSTKSTPIKDEATRSQSTMGMDSLVVNAIPISSIPPISPAKKVKKTSKKEKTPQVGLNSSSPSASIKKTKKKSKKSKTELRRSFTMSELHVDPLPSSGVATPIINPAEENVDASGKNPLNLGLDVSNSVETLDVENPAVSENLGKSVPNPPIAVDATIGASTETNDDCAAESLKKTGPETHVASSVVTPDAEPNVVPDPVSKVVPRTEEKGKAKKRKAPPTSDSEFEPETDNGSARWKFVYHRRLALERNLKEDILQCQSVVEAIEYAAIPEYRQVFVRGKCVKFSPTVINQYLQRHTEEVADLKVTDNEVYKVITGGRVKIWPTKAKLAATSLSPLYAILNRVAAHNWVPTTHSGDVARGLGKFIYAVGTKAKFDYGSYFFHETLSHAMTYAVEKPVAFPTLLCNVILEQHLDILRSTDVPCTRKGGLTIEQRLLEGTNVAASVGSSVQAGVLSRKQMIADLTEASRALEARKLKIDRVIEALKAEEAAEITEGEPDRQEGIETSGSEDGTEDMMEDSDEIRRGGVYSRHELVFPDGFGYDLLLTLGV